MNTEASPERSEGTCDPSQSTSQDFEHSTWSQEPESALSPNITAGAMKKIASYSPVPEFTRCASVSYGAEGDPMVDGPPPGNSQTLKRTYALSEHCETPALSSSQLTS